MLAWHFCEESRRTRWNDLPIVVGGTIKHDGKLVLCESGLHASAKALDALVYAPGPIICRVKLSGEILTSEDKLVASERTCIAMADATDILWSMARWYALQVIHFWDAPAGVREFLETGKEELRAAAGEAAEAAARAARAAAWGAAGAAARAAAWAAAGDAAWAAAWAAAGEAAWGDAWGDARDKQSNELERRFKELLRCE